VSLGLPLAVALLHLHCHRRHLEPGGKGTDVSPRIPVTALFGPLYHGHRRGSIQMTRQHPILLVRAAGLTAIQLARVFHVILSSHELTRMSLPATCST
jgi:hypothetical protein